MPKTNATIPKQEPEPVPKVNNPELINETETKSWYDFTQTQIIILAVCIPVGTILLIGLIIVCFCCRKKPRPVLQTPEVKKDETNNEMII